MKIYKIIHFYKQSNMMSDSLVKLAFTMVKVWILMGTFSIIGMVILHFFCKLLPSFKYISILDSQEGFNGWEIVINIILLVCGAIIPAMWLMLDLFWIGAHIMSKGLN